MNSAKKPHNIATPPQSQRTVAVVQQGPLPTSAEFAGYEQVLPGAAERLIKLVEQDQQAQAEHIRSVDAAQAKAIEYSHAENMAQIALGHWFIGFLVIVGIASFGVWYLVFNPRTVSFRINYCRPNVFKCQC